MTIEKPIIEFKNVSKVFEDSNTKVLKDINFELEEGKFYTLLGASGSGKSTILNIIAGLLDATTGDILLDGVRINDIPTNKRDVHTVFQSYALFPHMNVFENVAFPLRLRKIDKKEIEKRVAEVLKMVQLEGYENVPFVNYLEDNASVWLLPVPSSTNLVWFCWTSLCQRLT